MLIEVDSSNIIAYILSKKQVTKFISIPVDEVQKYAQEIESQNGDVRTVTDMISIDAFRCAFSSSVKVDQSEITITDISEIQSYLNRLLPSKKVVALLDNVTM